MSNDNAGDYTDDRSALVKATLAGKDNVPESNVFQAIDEEEDNFKNRGAIVPPYQPRTMVQLFEHSNALRQNVDAYATNIDGFGHRFDPVIDLDADDVNDKIGNAMFFEELARIEDETGMAPAITGQVDIPEAEVEARKEEIARAMLVERSKLECFFDSCTTNESFISLRRKTRQDIEVLGNGFWEVLRNGAGEVVEFVYIPGFTMRLMPLDKSLTTTKVKVKGPDMKLTEEKRLRRFRRYIQISDKKTVYFKDFGDPRIVSALTGKPYKNMREFAKAEKSSHGGVANLRVATEVIHFAIHSPRTAYGVPRWVGNLLAVMGNRQAEEVNFLYFENKSVPPMALLVSGGRLNQSAVKRVEDFVENKIRGRRNFHKMLILEAESMSAGNAMNQNGTMKLELVPLTSAQQSDALFQNYDERNIDKVGMSFRLPRMLRGDIRDFNKSTAESALEFAEMQVFAPERNEFDFMINKKILPDLGIQFTRFISNGPTTKDPEMLSTIIERLTKAGILVPHEARQLSEQVFGVPLKNIDEEWTQLPIELTKAGIAADDVTTQGDTTRPVEDNFVPEAAAKTAGKKVAGQSDKFSKLPPSIAKMQQRVRSKKAKDIKKEAEYLINLREEFKKAETEIHQEAFTEARKRHEGEAEVITVPDDIMKSFFEEDGND